MRVYVIGVAVFILLDIVSGLLKSWYLKDFKSSVMRSGLFHKVGEIIVLGLLYLVEIEAPVMGLEIGLPMFKVGCGYCAIMEIGSIIENLRAFTPGIDYIIHKEDKKNGEEDIPVTEQSEE